MTTLTAKTFPSLAPISRLQARSACTFRGTARLSLWSSQRVLRAKRKPSAKKGTERKLLSFRGASSFSTSLPVASGAGERAFALSYARIDAAMFQQRDAEFNVAVSIPWQSDLEASSDDDDEDGDCEMGDDSI